MVNITTSAQIHILFKLRKKIVTSVDSSYLYEDFRQDKGYQTNETNSK